MEEEGAQCYCWFCLFGYFELKQKCRFWAFEVSTEGVTRVCGVGFNDGKATQETNSEQL